MLKPSRKYWVLALVTLALSVNLFDRWLLSLLLEPIKRDFSLTDTQLGFLSGVGSSLLAVLLSVPIARWADRADRVKVATIAMGFWAAAVMAVSATVSFGQLLGARLCASFGDAGVDPPLRSLVGDYFVNARERTRAMFVLAASGTISSVIAFSIAGVLSERVGWRLTFLCASIPGVVVALLLRFTVADPGREQRKAVSAPGRPSIRGVLSCVWRKPTCRRIGLGICLAATLGQGLGPWYGAFLVRTYHISTGELGFWLGGVFGVGGALGLVIGMYAFDRWAAGDDRRQLRLAAAGLALSFPFLLLFLLLPVKVVAIACLAPFTVASSLALPPLVAQLQRLVPDTMRASIVAIVFTIGNSVGILIGPQMVGVISDLLSPSFGVDGLRYAMVLVALSALLGAHQLVRASVTVEADMQALDPIGNR